MAVGYGAASTLPTSSDSIILFVGWVAGGNANFLGSVLCVAVTQVAPAPLLLPSPRFPSFTQPGQLSEGVFPPAPAKPTQACARGATTVTVSDPRTNCHGNESRLSNKRINVHDACLLPAGSLSARHLCLYSAAAYHFRLVNTSHGGWVCAMTAPERQTNPPRDEQELPRWKSAHSD